MAGPLHDALERARASLFRRGRTPGLRTAKATLAAVLSFLVAERLGTSAAPVLAPLTALLVVQLTLYETVTHGITRVASVLAGVLVALAVASRVGLTWWSLGVVVAVSLVLGRLLRLGPNLLEVPITAMIVLSVGGQEGAAAGRVYETLIGAAGGLLVNLVVAPPLYMQPAGDAIGDLAERMGRLLRQLADELRSGWSREAADRWLDQARALGSELDRADVALARAEQSALFNPRRSAARDAQPQLRSTLTGLEHAYVSLRSLCRALLDRTYFVPEREQGEAYGEEVRQVLADVLVTAAAAIEEIGGMTSLPQIGSVVRDDVVDGRLPELRELRDRLAALVVVDPQHDAAAWQQHGALLASVDRLRTEVEAAVRPPTTPWRPPLVGEQQREAVRRAVTTGRVGSRSHRWRRPGSGPG